MINLAARVRVAAIKQFEQRERGVEAFQVAMITALIGVALIALIAVITGKISTWMATIQGL